ncbi:MAG: D-glycerate dehydrogenase [Anaerolineae bacterium]|nr:D-glycerate dehydrogenase [Anaerolineae bacterium]MDH7473945.1 D-glycerate dehydrogenase [Anaerolineae bacterium]
MVKPKVYVTRMIPQAGLDMVRTFCETDVWEEETPPPREVLLQKVQGIDGLLALLTDTIDAALMDAAGPQLRVISNYAVGYDNVDVAAATVRGILVTNTPGVLTDTTADFAFTLLMAAARRVVEGMDYIRAGKWLTWGPTLLLGQDIHHATLGIIGMGRIGSGMARRAQGFEMRVLYYDPYCRKEKGEEVGAECVDLDTLLAESDFVSVHVPLTPETYHMLGAEQFRKMKPSAILINTARGPIVDSDALYEALKNGEIAYAALDVTEPEPLPADHKLLTLPNIIICPHIASASVITRTKMATMAAENLIAGLKGEMPPYPVNPEVLLHPK